MTPEVSNTFQTIEWANNACTRLGVGPAFFELFSGFEFCPFRRRVQAPTPSG